MKLHLFGGGGRDRERFDELDPIAEGLRYRLAAEVSLAIWRQVCRELPDDAASRDKLAVRRRFHEIAAQVAERGGRLRPDVGRVTRVGLEIDGDPAALWRSHGLTPAVPGRTTQVLEEARRWSASTEQPTRDGEPVPRRDELPGTGEVARALAALFAPGAQTSSERWQARVNASEDASALIREVAELAPTIGVSADEVAIEMSERATAMVGARGLRALYDDGVIYLPMPLARDPLQRRQSLAHELTHAAQRRLPSRGGEPAHEVDAAEQEASAIGTAARAGAPLWQPRAPLPRRWAADDPRVTATGKGKGKGKDDGPRLQAGINVELQGNALVFRTSWFLSDRDFERIDANSVKAPGRFPEIMRRAKPLFWWMTDADIAKTSKWILHGFSAASEQTEFFKFDSYLPSCYELIGLPPDTDLQWRRTGPRGGQGAMLVISTRALPRPDPPVAIKAPRPLRQRIWDQLENDTDVEIDRDNPGAKQHLVDQEWPTLDFSKVDNAWVFTFDHKQMLGYVANWDEEIITVYAHPKQGGTSKYKGVHGFSNDLGPEDREFVLAWMERINGDRAPGARTRFTAELVAALRELDKHPDKDKILEKIKGTNKLLGKDLDADTIRKLIHDWDLQAAKDLVKLAPGTAADHPRLYQRPVPGRIRQLGGLVWAGKKIEFLFEIGEPLMVLAFPMVVVQWTVSPKGEPASKLYTGTTSHYAFHPPDKWEMTFKEADLGPDHRRIFEVHAFVDHDLYWPTHVTPPMEVMVETESDRLGEQEEEAFAGMGSRTTYEGEGFETSWSDEYDKGNYYYGGLPQDFKHRTIEERAAFLGTDRSRVEALIKRYEKRSDKEAVDMCAYAEAYIKRIDASKAALDAEAKDGYRPFELRGTFLSGKSGIPDKQLNLIGLAKPANGSVDMKIHDFSQVYEPKHYHFSGSGSGFFLALRDTFVAMCKSYPPGRVSILAARLDDNTLDPTGETLGFELHTGTLWKDVKEVVWAPTVQLVVNFAGACAMIFLPGIGTAAFVIITAYNAIDTLDNLAQLQEKGIATTGDKVEAGVMIGLDLLPFLGKAKRLGRLGKAITYAADGLQIAGNMVILTEKGLRDLEAFRDSKVQRVADLQAQIDELMDNPSNPQIAVLKKELAEEVKAAQDEGDRMIRGLVTQGFILSVTPIVFNHIKAGAAKEGVGKLDEGKMLVHAPGVEPHYDPASGKIIGDKTKLTADKLPALEEAIVRDTYRKQAELANVLGTAPEKVRIERGGKTVVITPDGETKVVTIPEGWEFKTAVTEAWNIRKAGDPHAPKDRPAPIASTEAPVYSPADVVARSHVVVGNRVGTRSDGEKILDRLAAGDRAALASTGLGNLPHGFDPKGVEWGLGVLSDGSHVVIRGDGGHVDWGRFPDVKPVAHTHSYRGTTGKKIGGDGIKFDDLVSSAGPEDVRAAVFPSAADFAFAARNRLGGHKVVTPYVHKGGKKITNPTAGAADPRVEFEIGLPERAGSYQGADHIPIYKSRVKVTAGGEPLWEGDVFAVHHPQAKSEIKLAFDPAWKPHASTGGGAATRTPAPVRAPRNELEEKALADWKKLEASEKEYTGIYDSDAWYDRYNDGLVYDIEGRQWIRPDGRKVKDPIRFDSAAWTKHKVFDHLAGRKSDSTFKAYFEMLKTHLGVDEAAVKKKVEEIGPLGKDSDIVRHELKEAYREQVMQKMMEPATPEAKHARMREMTKGLDSSDKGSLTEEWYRRTQMGADAKTHVAARRGEVLGGADGKTPIEIDKNRYVDVIEGSTAKEIKSGEGALSDTELAQLEDYARMVTGEARLSKDGTVFVIKEAHYVFTSPDGARANVETMRNTLKRVALQDKLRFEVFTPEGKIVTIGSQADLDAQAWLVKK